MSIIVFLVILAALVLVHEFGHFISAKRAGIRVDEFGLGFPPRLWSFKKGETLYSLNLVPFGGFVKIHGENPDEEALTGPDSARSFVNKPRHIQAIVLAAGVIGNIIFAWLLLSASFMIGIIASSDDYAKYVGRITDPRVVVVGTAKGSPAEAAGLKAGDALISIESGGRVLKPPFEVPDVQAFINESGEGKVKIFYKRGDRNLAAEIVPKEGIVEGRKVVGISMDKVGTLRLPVHFALYEGAKFTTRMVEGVSVGLAQFIAGAFVGKADLSSVSGPVGIVGLVGDATKLGITYLLTFTALISVNLAVINLIPFPALDGGRLLFVIIEAIIRKRIKPAVMNITNAVGFFILIALMLFITYKDILKLLG